MGSSPAPVVVTRVMAAYVGPIMRCDDGGCSVPHYSNPMSVHYWAVGDRMPVIQALLNAGALPVVERRPW